MRIFLPKAIKFFIALLLLPAFPPLFTSICQQAKGLNERTLFLENPLSLALGGLILWSIFALFFRFPSRFYVFGHELTHALFVKFCGGQVKKISVKQDRGFVLSDRSNFLIVLAPYLFPFYAVVFTSFTTLLALWMPISQLQIPLWIGIGFFLGYHWTMTGKMLTTKQSDFSSQGYFFSFVFTLIVNFSMILFFLLLLPSPKGFGIRLSKLGIAFLKSYQDVFSLFQRWISI